MSLIKDLTSISVWQAANYALPLVTFPYLARVLGVDGFGMIGFAGAITALAITFAEWGFALSATQSVAKIRDQLSEVNALVWAIVFGKFLLASLSVLLIFSATFILQTTLTTKLIFWASAVNVISSVINVDWALRGVGRFSDFAIGSVLGRLTSVPLVYFLVRSHGDVLQAVIANAAGSIAVSGFSLYFAWRSRIISAPKLSYNESLAQIRSGSSIFLSQLSINFYTNLLSIALGWTSSVGQVGLYSSADKIRKPLQGLMNPIMMVFFPKMSTMVNTNIAAARSASLRILVLQGGASLLGSTILFLLSPFIVKLVFGPKFVGVINVLRVQSWLLFVIGVNSVLGLIILLPFGYKREFNFCVSSGAVVGVLFVFPMSFYFGAVGTSVAALVSELTVLILMFFAVEKNLKLFEVSQLFRRV